MPLYYVYRAKDGLLGQHINAPSGTQARQVWAKIYRYLWPKLRIAEIAAKASYRLMDRQNNGGRPRIFE